jgi:hypothetical protein
MDPESLAVLRSVAGSEHRIPPGLHDRLAGESIGALRSDAAKLAQALGIAPPDAQARDAGGRFASGDMNAVIRRASGRAAA